MFALQYVLKFEGRAKTIEINTSGVDYVIPGKDYIYTFSHLKLGALDTERD